MKDRFKTLVDDQIRDDKFCQTQLEDFRFIIFSGEAKPSEFRKIREAVVEVIPEFENRFLHDIDPFWVGAVGIAKWAKKATLDPPDKEPYRPPIPPCTHHHKHLESDAKMDRTDGWSDRARHSQYLASQKLLK